MQTNGETKTLVNKAMWSVLSLAITGVIGLGVYVFNDMKHDIDLNQTQIEIIKQAVVAVKDEQLKRTSRIEGLEKRVEKLEVLADQQWKVFIQFEREYRMRFGYYENQPMPKKYEE